MIFMRFRRISFISVSLLLSCLFIPFSFVSASKADSSKDKELLLINERLDRQDKEIAYLHKRVNALTEALLRLQNPSNFVKITDDDIVVSIEPDDVNS